jgi:hypothetical protein
MTRKHEYIRMYERKKILKNHMEKYVQGLINIMSLNHISLFF